MGHLIDEIGLKTDFEQTSASITLPISPLEFRQTFLDGEMKLVRSLTALGVTIIKVGPWEETDDDFSLFEGESVIEVEESKTMHIFNLGTEHSPAAPS